MAESEEAPSYAALYACVHDAYQSTGDPLPSSLSLESSPRHIDKLEANRHLEEQRSRWLVRAIDCEELGINVP